MSYIRKLYDQNLITPPAFVYHSLVYEVIMGSLAYGVSSDNSDIDVYGCCLPDKEYIFPQNYIPIFDPQHKNFEQYQQHHIFSKDGKQEFDFSVYGITKFFRLCANGNPNMIDSLFVPDRCIIHMSPIGKLIRDNRELFLSKKCWHSFKGYAYSQLHKMDIKKPNPKSKRYESIMKYGYDVKFAYHIVRLLDEIEQILTLEDLDLERSREQMKSVRRGEWTKEEIKEYFKDRESDLEKVHLESDLPYKIREEEIRELLVKCLTIHYKHVKELDNKQTNSRLLLDLETLVRKYK